LREHVIPELHGRCKELNSFANSVREEEEEGDENLIADAV